MVRRFPSWMPSTAAMRPLIAAEPMLRAPRPAIASASATTGPAASRAGAGGARGGCGRPRSCLAACGLPPGGSRRRALGAALEDPVVERDIRLDRVERDLRLVLAAFRPDLHCKREIPPVHRLVVAERDLDVTFIPSDRSLDVDPDRDVPSRHRGSRFGRRRWISAPPGPVDVGALDLIGAYQFYGVPLCLVVEQGIVELGRFDDRLQFVLAE